VLVLVTSSAQAAGRGAAVWSICGETPLRGDFEAYRAPQIGISLPGAPDAANRLLNTARAARLATREVAGVALDHGALVPLYFLQRAGWQGATLLVNMPGASLGDEIAMGRAIADSAEASGQRWAIAASGDLSQRLTPNAVDGYHPRAKDFDRIFRTRLEAGDLHGACTINRDLCALANERASRPCSVVAGAVNYRSDGQHTYAYESPFGVGYLSAVLYEADVPREPGGTRPRELWPWPNMLDIARQAMSAKLRYNPFRPHALPEPWNAPRGVFVKLRDPAGNERGCVGHVEPQHGTLAEEIAACAAVAVTHDTRFARVTLHELGELDIEIAMLSKPELVQDTTKLDPQRYGVIVSSGRYSGVQLPAVASIGSVEQQLTAAAIKGQLPSGRAWVIARFEVQESSESKLRAQQHATRLRDGF
jgi:AMMECR1 domain-containing protein